MFGKSTVSETHCGRSDYVVSEAEAYDEDLLGADFGEDHAEYKGMVSVVPVVVIRRFVLFKKLS